MQNVQNIQNLQSLSKSAAISQAQRIFSYITGMSGLVAYWPLDELSGDAVNKAPNTLGQLSGTVSGATQGVDGQSGKAYSFNGSDNRIVVSDNDNIEGMALFSLSILFNCSDTGVFRKLLFKDGVFDIGVNSSGEIFAEFVGIQNLGTLGSSPVVDDGLWNMLTITYDGSTIKAYINGSEVESVSGLSGSIGTGGLELFIGNNGGSEWWLGLLQHLALWNVALSQSQVEELYQLFF